MNHSAIDTAAASNNVVACGRASFAMVILMALVAAP
jgi:hypothetical protein